MAAFFVLDYTGGHKNGEKGQLFLSFISPHESHADLALSVTVIFGAFRATCWANNTAGTDRTDVAGSIGNNPFSYTSYTVRQKKKKGTTRESGICKGMFQVGRKNDDSNP